MPPKVGEITINFIPRSTPLRAIEPKFPKLYNLHLDMIEDKKKVAKIIPKVPEWHKMLPPKEDVIPTQPEVKRDPVKIERPIPSGKPQPVASKTSIPKKPEPIESIEEATEDDKTDGETEEELVEDETEGDNDGSGSEEESVEDESEDESESESDETKDELDIESNENTEVGEEKSLDENPRQKTLRVVETEDEDPESFLREKKIEKRQSREVEEKIPEGYEENLTDEEKEARAKAGVLRKWKFLKYRIAKVDPKKAETMPDFNDLDDIKIVTKRYEDEVYELKIISNTERYRRMLLSGFMGVEAISKKLGTDFFNDYTKFQFSIMSEYDSILMEMGESNQDSFLANASPEVKLLGTIAFTTFAFAAGKYANAPVAKMLGLATGYEPQKSSEGISPPDKVHLD